MKAVASVLLAALTCLLGVYTPFNYEPAPTVQLPFTKDQRSGCVLFDGPGLVISADAGRHLYFAQADRTIQTEVIRRVAARHGVRLNGPQLAVLAKLPFLGLDGRSRPAYLAWSPPPRRPGIANSARPDELTEYVAMTQAVTRERTGHTAYVILQLDRALPAGEVKRLLLALRQQGIPRPFFVANLQP